MCGEIACRERCDGARVGAGYLGAGTELENGKHVGEIVAKDVARDRDGVEALHRPVHRGFDGVGRLLDRDVEAGGVVEREVLLNLGQQRPVVRTLLQTASRPSPIGGPRANQQTSRPKKKRGKGRYESPYRDATVFGRLGCVQRKMIEEGNRGWRNRFQNGCRRLPTSSSQKMVASPVARARETASRTQSLIGASFVWHIRQTSPFLTACSNTRLSDVMSVTRT